MKNLLIVAYYFPPSGGPGVQRVLKHVKYLPEFGWQPIVLTVSNGQFPARDESLLSQIPETVKVYRSRIFEPYDIYRILTGKKPGSVIDVNVIKKDNQEIGFKEKIAEFIRATFFIPDARVAWMFSAVNTVKEILKENKIDAVYSSSPPYTCSLIAKSIRNKLKIPWVAGFRDPWTGFISSPKRWFLPAMIDRRLEHSVFTGADAVECAWEGIIKDAFSKYPDLEPRKFHHVPNGYDSSDFPKVEIKRNEKFTVTYTGSMYGRRNPASFFMAVSGLINSGRVNPDEIKLKFIGRFGAEVEEMFSDSPFRGSIETIPYMPHDRSIAELMLSDALLLVVDESKESEEIVPGKVYEYIGVRKPIIAVAPVNGAISTLIRETNSGKVAHQSDIAGIADAFLEYYNLWKSGSEYRGHKVNEVIKYERRESARMLASILNNMI